VSQSTLLGLFSGIGGLERGFEREGFRSVAVAEIDSACTSVLDRRMAAVPNLGDITKIDRLPDSDVIAAGFPCQPYSQAGRRDGLERGRTPLRHLLRLIESARPAVVVLENVAFILHLQRGAAVTRVTNRLSRCGYSWAFRLVDSRSFGLPQRRLRWILVAARDLDASRVLFGDEPANITLDSGVAARGFYWTEGTSGIGWADNAVPPLKGGSTLGIPCAPAIWDLERETIVTPDIRDAERLQGFPANWTQVPSAGRAYERARWRLIGNAVSVPVARWIAFKILRPSSAAANTVGIVHPNDGWPRAALGWKHRRYEVAVPTSRICHNPILKFLKYEPYPLSYGATRGFRMRYEHSLLRKDIGFITALRDHERRMHAASA
jgi:DNA (cytosine-5)-methyltransferase 1